MQAAKGLETNLALDLGESARPDTSLRLTQWQPAMWPVDAGWQPLMGDFLASANGKLLAAFIEARLAQGATIYPSQPLRALALTAPASVKVVILGQDPYHGPGQAEGLAFSVAPGQRLPPSLRNIYKEIQRDLGLPVPPSGSLVHWATQGVLLLNTSLTVEDGSPASHARQGWEVLTDRIIRQVAVDAPHCVFMLWGAHAQAKAGLIEAAADSAVRHRVLQANHPSPLSALRPPRPFLGCGHFGVANVFLLEKGLTAVNW